MRLPLIAGNWKMYKTAAEAAALAAELRDSARPEGVEVLVAPPFTALPAVAQALRGSPIHPHRISIRTTIPESEEAPPDL